MLQLNMFILYVHVFKLSSSEWHFGDATQLIGAHVLQAPHG